jgi:hypothetical protein
MAPVTNGQFSFNVDTFYVATSGGQIHRRAAPAEIKALYDTSADKSTPDHPGHWYEAQLLHYGLPPSKVKATAKMRLLKAVQDGGLAVPKESLQIEKNLKKEWKKQDSEEQPQTNTKTTTTKTVTTKTVTVSKTVASNTIESKTTASKTAAKPVATKAAVKPAAVKPAAVKPAATKAATPKAAPSKIPRPILPPPKPLRLKLQRPSLRPNLPRPRLLLKPRPNLLRLRRLRKLLLSSLLRLRQLPRRPRHLRPLPPKPRQPRVLRLKLPQPRERGPRMTRKHPINYRLSNAACMAKRH